MHVCVDVCVHAFLFVTIYVINTPLAILLVVFKVLISDHNLKILARCKLYFVHNYRPPHSKLNLFSLCMRSFHIHT